MVFWEIPIPLFRQIQVVVGEDGLEVVATLTYLLTAALKPIEDRYDFDNLTTGFLDRVRGIKQGPSGRHGIVDDDDSAIRSKRPFNLFHGAVPLSVRAYDKGVDGLAGLEADQ